MYDDKTCLLWSNMDTYKHKEKRTIDNISAMLKIVKNPYIAFSCGKDSSVLADIVLSINSTIPCRFISSGETRIIHNVDDVMQYFVEKHKANIQEILFDRVWSEEWKNATFDVQRKAGRRDIQSIDNNGYDGVFMGLRKQESRGRCLSLIMHNTKELPRNMYRYNNKDYYRMCPLADWNIEDVGAYIVSHNIPTLDWYKKFGYEGRTTARLTGDSVRQNTISYIKMTNPLGYQKIIMRFPELSVYS